MKKEKEFHANYVEKHKRYMCKVQINGERKPFYGHTEEEAIQKAKQWYQEKLDEQESCIHVEKIEDKTNTESNTNKEIVEQLDKIGNLLQNKNLNNNSDDIYITVDEAKDYLRISKNQMYSLIHQPDFPRQKFGRTYRILFSELKDYMKKHRFTQITL